MKMKKKVTIPAGAKRPKHRTFMKLAGNALYYRCRFLDPIIDPEDNIHKLPGLINGFFPWWSSNRAGFNWDAQFSHYKLVHYVYNFGKRLHFGYDRNFYPVEIGETFFILLYTEEPRFLMFVSKAPIISYNIDTLEKTTLCHEFLNSGIKSPITFQSNFFIEPPEKKDTRFDIEFFNANKFRRFGVGL